jgi:hypothetical protein
MRDVDKEREYGCTNALPTGIAGKEREQERKRCEKAVIQPV